MDFTRALMYPFDDPDWLSKLGIAVGISILMIFVPVIGTILGALLLSGWAYETAKNVRNGVPNPMPAWSDFGGLLSRGLTLTIALFVYEIPAIIGICAASGIWVLPTLSGGDEDALGALMGGASLISICCCCLIFIFLIAAYVFYAGGYIRYMDNEELGTFFQFGDNIALVRNNGGDFGQALLFMMIGGLIGSLVSGTGIGALVVPAFQNYYNAHIIGQLAAKLRGGTMMPQV